MKEPIIVIIGGTFNPPTLAHLELARRAKEKVNADYVIFVPAKTSYLRNWKKYQNSDIYDDKVRIQMIKSCETDWLKIDTCEIDEIVSGSSYDTIQYLKNKYHTKEIYFAVGSDKLEEIPRWKYSELLLTTEKFLVMKRNYDNIEEIIKSNDTLKKYKDSFILCDSSEEYQTYSSTQVRKMIEENNIRKLQNYIPKQVIKILISSNIIYDKK